MNEYGEQHHPEQDRKEPNVDNIVVLFVELLGGEVREDFEGLEFEDALGYAYTLLMEAGEDPCEYFKSKGIIIE